jgi:hypothetical protein
MRDYAGEPDCDYTERDLPRLVGLEFEPGSESAMDDLFWRLEVQLPDMGLEGLDDEQVAVDSRVARNVCRKIRKGQP